LSSSALRLTQRAAQSNAFYHGGVAGRGITAALHQRPGSPRRKPP